jgi:poly-D-alanine transfer protein DltD
MSDISQSLWDDQWIKQQMESIAREYPMRPFMDTSTTSSTYPWNEKPRKYITRLAKEVKEKKVEESLKSDPQFFDPKELDIDD